MTYTGANCPVCGQKFTDQDDVVVCPDCGTPYHRACYKEKGRCIMDELHESGKEWVNPNQPEPVKKATIVQCPACGEPNPAEEPMCDKCGFPLDQKMYQRQQEDPRQAAYDSLEHPLGPDDHIHKISVRDLIAFVQKNAQHYIRLFTLASQNFGATALSWSALFFGPFFYFYRKMYKEGLLYLIIDLASYLPSFAVVYHLMPQALADSTLLYTMNFNTSGMETLLTIANIASYIPFILHIYCAFTANQKYYNHTMSTISRLQKQFSADRHEFERQVVKCGGVNPLAVFLAVFASAAAFLLISVFITVSLLPLVG